MAIAVGDIVTAAVAVLDKYGFADLSMRAIAAELGVAPGALYYHVPNKQTLLCRVAQEILGEMLAVENINDSVTWPPKVAAPTLVLAHWASRFRETLLNHRDSAELVMAVFSMRKLSLAAVPMRYFTVAEVPQPEFAAENLVLLVLSQVMDEQAYLVFTELGTALTEAEGNGGNVTSRGKDGDDGVLGKPDFAARFTSALETYLAGIFPQFLPSGYSQE